MDSTIVNTIILEQFGVLPLEITPIEMGVMTFKYKVKVNRSFYILRIYPHENNTLTNLEFTIMQHLFALGCKVPEPVHYNNTKEPHWLLYNFINGQPLSLLPDVLTSAAIQTISGEIMNTLLSFTKEPVQGFGFLLTGDSIFSSWKDFLKESVERGALHLTSIKELDGPTAALLLDFAAKQLDRIVVQVPCLVWSDFSPGNIIVHENHLAGLVDFEGCISGDPALALGYLFAIEGHSNFFESMLLQFKQHYPITFDQVVFYAIIRLFRLSKYFNFAFPTGINRDPLTEYFKGIPAAVAYVKSL